MSEQRGITVLGICGSLRAGSYNKATLRTAIELKPPGMTIETADIGSIPLYNEDVRAARFSTARREIAGPDRRRRCAALCDPGIQLFDAGRLEERDRLGLAPRPTDQPFAGKPIAIMGAGAGMAGTARAQYDLRRCCVFLDMHPVNRPEVLIGQAQTKFDAQGRLTDEAARGFIRDLLVALDKWTRLIGRK